MRRIWPYTLPYRCIPPVKGILVSHPLFERHRETLEAAVDATRTRRYFSAYPEVPSGKIYGETAKDDGLAAFQGRLGKPFASRSQSGVVMAI